MSDLKKCSKCKKEVPKTQFYPNTAKKGGLHNECKECSKQRKASAEYRNSPSQRKRWAENTFNLLGINDSDY